MHSKNKQIISQSTWWKIIITCDYQHVFFSEWLWFLVAKNLHSFIQMLLYINVFDLAVKQHSIDHDKVLTDRQYCSSESYSFKLPALQWMKTKQLLTLGTLMQTLLYIDSFRSHHGSQVWTYKTKKQTMVALRKAHTLT